MRRAQDLPHLVEQPEARRWFAWMLLRRGEAEDAARARQLLDEAINQYRALGMARHVEIAEELLADA